MVSIKATHKASQSNEVWATKHCIYRLQNNEWPMFNRWHQIGALLCRRTRNLSKPFETVTPGRCRGNRCWTSSRPGMWTLGRLHSWNNHAIWPFSATNLNRWLSTSMLLGSIFEILFELWLYILKCHKIRIPVCARSVSSCVQYNLKAFTDYFRESMGLKGIHWPQFSQLFNINIYIYVYVWYTPVPTF